MYEGKTILSLCIKTRSSWTMALKRATISWCLGKTFEIVGRIWSCPYHFLFKRFSWFNASEVVGITQIVEQLHLQTMSAFPGPISPAVRTEMKMLPTRHYSGLLDGGTKQFAVWVLRASHNFMRVKKLVNSDVFEHFYDKIVLFHSFWIVIFLLIASDQH